MIKPVIKEDSIIFLTSLLGVALSYYVCHLTNYFGIQLFQITLFEYGFITGLIGFIYFLIFLFISSFIFDKLANHTSIGDYVYLSKHFYEAQFFDNKQITEYKTANNKIVSFLDDKAHTDYKFINDDTKEIYIQGVKIKNNIKNESLRFPKQVILHIYYHLAASGYSLKSQQEFLYHIENKNYDQVKHYLENEKILPYFLSLDYACQNEDIKMVKLLLQNQEIRNNLNEPSLVYESKNNKEVCIVSFKENILRFNENKEIILYLLSFKEYEGNISFLDIRDNDIFKSQINKNIINKKNMERQLENIVRFHDIDNVKLYLKKNSFEIEKENISNFNINPMLIAFNQEKYDILNLIYHSPLFKERIKHLTETQIEDFQKVMISSKLNQF